VVCSRSSTTEKTTIDHYFKAKDDSELIHLAPEDFLLKKSASYNQNDGVISCKFSRRKSIDNRYVNNLALPHYIQIERGSLGKKVYYKNCQFFIC
jgi:hypothetical protein